WRTDASIEEHLTPRQLAQRSIRAERIDVLRRFRELGVKLIASTDAGMTRTPFDDLPNLVLFLMREIGMTTAEAIHSVTGRAAAAVRREEFGTIAPGRKADLRLIDGDPELDPTVLVRPTRVVKDGVTVHRAEASVSP